MSDRDDEGRHTARKNRRNLLRLAFGGLATIASFGPVALAGPEDGSISHDGEGPVLYITEGDTCSEEYAREMAQIGLTVRVSKLRTLEAVTRIAEVPADVKVNHMLLVGGYVVVNHVSPETVRDLVMEMPKVRGLIGSSECIADDHSAAHAERVRQF